MNARRDGKGLAGDYEARVRELWQCATACWVAVESECGIVTVENILRGQIEADTPRQLIFRFSTEYRIPRQRLLKVGLVATKKLL